MDILKQPLKDAREQTKTRKSLTHENSKHTDTHRQNTHVHRHACMHTHTHTDTHITEGQNLCGGKTIVHLVDDA